MSAIRALITRPTLDVLTIEQVKAHLREDSSDNDAVIGTYLAAAVDHLDPAGRGWLCRALRPQTWELRFECFPDCIDIPFPPLISITSFKYDDTDGVEQTLVANTNYKLVGSDTDYPRIIPAYGTSWPSARPMPESVRLRYQCGYAATPTDTMPSTIKQWILMRIATWFENREEVVIGAPVAEIPHMDAKLFSLRPFTPQ